MRAFGLIGVIVAALVALAAGVIGYTLGLGANVAASGTVVAYPYWGFGWFHPFFGLLFGILFLVLIFALIRRAVSGGRGRGYGPGWGRHSWYGPGGPDGQTREEMLERWHRQAHGETTAPAGPGGDASKS
jgi:hypothetical protein